MKNMLTTHSNKLAMPVTCMARVKYSRLRKLAICAAVTDEWLFWCCSFKARTRPAYDRKQSGGSQIYFHKANSFKSLVTAKINNTFSI